MSKLNTSCALMMMFAASAANGQTTWHVDGDNACPGSGTKVAPFCTIQAGIDAAVAANGDDVLVANGTYHELINFNGKAITVHSSGGAGVTTIDGTGLNDTVVKCISGETPDTVLDGFTITGGDAAIGGGMRNLGNSSPTVINCTFSGNDGDLGGGMFNADNSNPTVTNCTFNGNSGIEGGGMYNNESSPTVTNCTFSGNSTVSGGGMTNAITSSPTVTNCILWGNSPDEIANNNSMPTVSFSNVQGGLGAGTINGGDNIDADPLFVDPDGLDGDPADDLHLGSCSPSVDAGDNDAVPVGVSTDRDGNPRFVDDAKVSDTGNPGAVGPPIVDMGASERQVDSGFFINVPGDFATIQEAIDAAFPCDEIIVAADTYDETINLLGKAITLRSMDPSDPAIVAATIIDGNGAGTVITCDSGEGPDTVIDGLTITGGTGSGGGMHNDNSSPTVTNCTFIDNHAGVFGGGMYNQSSNATVINCTFINNDSGGLGGGMLNFFGNQTVTNCTFIGNSAEEGGAMTNLSNSATVTHCTFSGNTADFGGGMMNNGSSPDVTHCVFIENSAVDGGGMYNRAASPTVNNCTFNGNTASSRGGGMGNSDGSPTVTQCTFSGNSAEFGGGMENADTSITTLTNCTFSGNSADFGGAMHNTDSSVQTLTNCILWGDSPDEIATDSSGAPTVSFSNVQGGLGAGTIDGGDNIDADPLFVDPDGADNTLGTDDDDLRLGDCSPATDAGDNDAVGGLVTADPDGNPRFIDDAEVVDTGNPGDVGPPVVDMGAYERQVDSVGNVHNITQGTFHCTIQDAIDTAVNGDEVVIADGTYTGVGNVDLNFNGKLITVRSSSGIPAQCIIDGQGTSGGFTFNTGETNAAVLDGVTITQCVRSSPDPRGGAILNLAASPTINNCILSGNTADFGGGMFNDIGSSPTVTNCTFSGNSADEGGGMFNRKDSSPTVANCTFSGNSADSNGGGMLNFISSPTVTNCTFSGNSACTGGGMHNTNSDLTVTNCAFSGNSADGGAGGGMINFSSSPTVTNCTFSGNSGVGTMFNVNSDPTVTNCILWGDTSSDEIANNNSAPTVSFSDIQGGLGAGTIDGGGNIDADPLFVDPDGADNMLGTDDDDLRLFSASPCIDVGDNTSIPADTADLDGDLDTAEPTPFDLDGNPRVSDGDLDTVATVDMGAYEIDSDSAGVVLNLTQSTTHDTIADAITGAIDGDELLASLGAFLTEPDIDFLSRQITLRSTGSISQPAGGRYELADGSTLETATGSGMTIRGELRVDPADSADVVADTFTSNPGSEINVRAGAGLYVTTISGAVLNGDLIAINGAVVDVAGNLTNASTMSLLNGVTLITDPLINTGTMQCADVAILADSFHNQAGGDFIANGEIYAPVTNDGTATYTGDTLAVGDYTNNGTTIVQIGTLTIIGSLLNNGTIIGDVSTSFARGTTQPGDGLSITGDYVSGPNAALIMPDPVWRLSVTGHYDAAINANANFNMIQAELRMAGLGDVGQNIEAMSADIGNCPAGLDRSLPGHYPMGTLHIGPTNTIVNLVDAHDNDQSGQGRSEAVYVRSLVIDSGATLNTNSRRVYYESLILDGLVDDPNNLIAIEPVPGDITGDCTTDLIDYVSFADCAAGPGLLPDPPAPILPQQCLDTFDFDNDHDVDVRDYGAFADVFGASSQD